MTSPPGPGLVIDQASINKTSELYPRLRANVIVEVLPVTAGVASIEVLDGPDYGNVTNAVDPNSIQTLVRDYLKFQVDGVQSNVAVRLTPTSGIWSVWLSFTDSPRHDSPPRQTFSASQTFTPPNSGNPGSNYDINTTLNTSRIFLHRLDVSWRGGALPDSAHVTVADHLSNGLSWSGFLPTSDTGGNAPFVFSPPLSSRNQPLNVGGPLFIQPGFNIALSAMTGPASVFIDAIYTEGR